VATHLGRTPFDVFEGAAREPLLAAFHEALATGRPVELTIQGRSPPAGARSSFGATLFAVRLRGEIAAVGMLLRGQG
jgi:hypothetical protein